MRIISQDGTIDVPYEQVVIQRYKEKIYFLNKNLTGVEQLTETKELRCKVCNHSLDIRKDNTYKVNVTNQIFKLTELQDATDCPYCGCQNLLSRRYEKVRNNQ